jgi:hypothetical protein
MRLPILVIAGALAAFAQSPEQAVLSVLAQIEKAQQAGDGQAIFDLLSAKSDMAAHPEFKARVRPRPEVRYQATKVLVSGDRAALVGALDDSFFSMQFVRENGSWKLLEQRGSNVPIDPAALYVLIPPDDGAFARAGFPWERVAPAPGTAKWKLQATYDETYLYVRIDAGAALPAPGSEASGTFPNVVTGVDRVWPHMRIRLAAPAVEFGFSAEDTPSDHATFDKTGKANSHRYTVEYSLWLFQGDHTLFYTSDPRIISIHDRYIDLRFPLKALGVQGKRGIAIADANRPGSFPPYPVNAF